MLLLLVGCAHNYASPSYLVTEGEAEPEPGWMVNVAMEDFGGSPEEVARCEEHIRANGGVCWVQISACSWAVIEQGRRGDLVAQVTVIPSQCEAVAWSYPE